MLDVLRGREVSDVVAVVTRWFGGVLLGAGGLVRAYGDAVRAGLDEVGVQTRRLMAEWAVDLAHAEAGRAESELRSRGIGVVDVTYADRVTLRLAVPPERGDHLCAVVAELTGGAVTPVAVGERWADEGA